MRTKQMKRKFRNLALSQAKLQDEMSSVISGVDWKFGVQGLLPYINQGDMKAGMFRLMLLAT